MKEGVRGFEGDASVGEMCAGKGAEPRPMPSHGRAAAEPACPGAAPPWRRSRCGAEPRPAGSAGAGPEAGGGAGPVGRERGMEKLRRLWRGRTMTFGVPLLVSGGARPWRCRGPGGRSSAAGRAGAPLSPPRQQLCGAERGRRERALPGAQGYGSKTYS